MDLIITNKTSYSIAKKNIIVFFALVSSVVIPQLFHLIGIASGTGKTVGVLFSPMHISVLFVGLFAGMYTGAITGLLAPVISCLLTGMPNTATLPLMAIELFGYGISAGLMRYVRIPVILKVLIAQIFGRVLRMLLCIFFYYVLSKDVKIFGIWTSIPRSLPGIVLQLTFIPLLLYRVEKRSEND